MKWNWAEKLDKNLVTELEVWTFEDASDYKFFDFRLGWDRKVDHAGLKFRFEIFKLLDVDFRIYDTRHWNYGEGRWYEKDEEFIEYLEDPDRENKYKKIALESYLERFGLHDKFKSLYGVSFDEYFKGQSQNRYTHSYSEIFKRLQEVRKEEDA